MNATLNTNQLRCRRGEVGILLFRGLAMVLCAAGCWPADVIARHRGLVYAFAPFG